MQRHAGARSLAIPSQLDGTRRTQYVLALIRSARERCRWQELELVQLGADTSGASGADIDDADLLFCVNNADDLARYS